MHWNMYTAYFPAYSPSFLGMKNYSYYSVETSFLGAGDISDY